MNAPEVPPATKPGSPEATTPTKKKIDDEPFDFKGWEELIRKSYQQAGSATDKALTLVNKNLEGVWKLSDEEVDLQATILARKLKRADIDDRKLENLILGISTGFLLVPRMTITGVEIFKQVRDLRKKPAAPAEQQEQMEQQVQEQSAQELEALREQMRKEWAAKGQPAK